MNPRESSENYLDAELRARLRVLASAPTPNLRRGRERVLAAAQERLVMPRRFSLALALGIGAAVILMMAAMSNAFGALPVATVALTRTNTSSATLVLPASAFTPAVNEHTTASAPRTPIPGIVPEPHRVATQTILP